MLKKILAALLAAVLLCGLLAACEGTAGSPKEPEEHDASYMELILTDWMRFISASEAMYEDLDWALSYIAAFGRQPDWDALLCARAAIELAAKRIELREEPSWDAPAEAYDYFMDREIDVAFVRPELENFEFNRQSLLNTCHMLRQSLMGDVFFRNGLSRTADTAAIEAEESQASLEYLAYSTEYLLLELNDAEWTEKVHKAMKESCPRIDAVRDTSLTAEELEEAASNALESISALVTDLSRLLGRSQAELDLLQEYTAQGEYDAIMDMFGAIAGLPELLSDPGWELTEAYYYWVNEDGTRRYLTKKEDLTSPPEHCVLEFSDVTEEEVAEYISFLDNWLGLSGERVDGGNGYYDVYFQAGDSILAVSWAEKGAAIYMLENPVCLAPDWFILANRN